MILPRCPEPTELGRVPIEEIGRRLREEILHIANIPLLGSQGLPRYLWIDCDWKSTLEGGGMSWQFFLKSISSCEADITNWIHRGIIWEDLLDTIEKSKRIQQHLMQK